MLSFVLELSIKNVPLDILIFCYFRAEKSRQVPVAMDEKINS